MNLGTEDRTFEGWAFCGVLERDVPVARGTKSKNDLRCTNRPVFLGIREYRFVGY